MTELAMFTRRSAVALLIAAGMARPASALSVRDAEGFVAGIIEDLRSLINSKAEGAEGANKFLSLLEEKAALTQVAKFAMGRNWRSMTDHQKDDYQRAFRRYISRTYARRFNEYAGEDIIVDGSIDAGKKGVLVKSTLRRPTAEDVAVEWLVTDRLGPLKLADIVFEGVSLTITLRDIFGGMVEKRGGNIDLFITDLRTSEGA